MEGGWKEDRGKMEGVREKEVRDGGREMERGGV